MPSHLLFGSPAYIQGSRLCHRLADNPSLRLLLLRGNKFCHLPRHKRSLPAEHTDISPLRARTPRFSFRRTSRHSSWEICCRKRLISRHSNVFCSFHVFKVRLDLRLTARRSLYVIAQTGPRITACPGPRLINSGRILPHPSLPHQPHGKKSGPLPAP